MNEIDVFTSYKLTQQDKGWKQKISMKLTLSVNENRMYEIVSDAQIAQFIS